MEVSCELLVSFNFIFIWCYIYCTTLIQQLKCSKCLKSGLVQVSDTEKTSGFKTVQIFDMLTSLYHFMLFFKRSSLFFSENLKRNVRHLLYKITSTFDCLMTSLRKRLPLFFGSPSITIRLKVRLHVPKSN